MYYKRPSTIETTNTQPVRAIANQQMCYNNSDEQRGKLIQIVLNFGEKCEKVKCKQNDQYLIGVHTYYILCFE